MQSLDILYIVLAVCALFISIPLMMVLFRVNKSIEHANKLLEYVNHLRELAVQFENVPMRFIEGILSNLSANTTKKK